MAIRIDFHIHTKAEPGKDHDFMFSLDWLKQYVTEAGLKAIAITNHNSFDLNNYNQVKDALKNLEEPVRVYPGMELDLAGGHTLIIFDDSEKSLRELMKGAEQIQLLDLGSEGEINIDQLKKFFPSWKDDIFVYEWGKANSIESFWDELADSVHAAGVNKPGNYFRREANHVDDASLLFSDAHATESDSEQSAITTRNDISVLKNKNSFLDTESLNFDAIRKAIKDKKVALSSNMLPEKFEVSINGESVEFSNGLNLLVGERGTGKSYLLNAFYGQGDESENITYLKQFQTAVNADDELKKIMRQRANDQKNKWVQDRASFFENIKLFFQDTNSIEEPDKYLDEIKKYGKMVAASNSAGKIRLLTSIKTTSLSNDWLKKAIRHVDGLLKEKRIWRDDVAVYQSTLEELRDKLIKKYRRFEYENQRNEYLNNILDSVQEAVRRETGVTSAPDFNLVEMFERNQIRKQINATMEQLIGNFELENIPISNYRLVTTFKKITGADDFRTYHGTKKPAKDALIKPYENKEYDKFFENLLKGDFLTATQSLGEFVGFITTELQTSSGAKASGGQAAGFVLMSNLEKGESSNVILLDEPEISLDSKFIKEQLVPTVQNMAKNHIIVVATHNSNVGSLLRPSQILVTKFDTQNNEYLVGSGDYNSGLMSVRGQNVPFADDFIDAMEAGYQQYLEKGNEYETVRNN